MSSEAKPLVYSKKYNRWVVALACFTSLLLVRFALLQVVGQFVSTPPCIGNARPGFNILILSSAQYPAWTELTGDELQHRDKPLLCDHVIFHGASVKYVKKHVELTKHQIEWAENFPKDCLLSISPTCRPAARIPGSHQHRDYHKFEGKLYAIQYLQHLLEQSRITSSAGSIPWAMFTDVDFVFANKHKGLESVISRLRSGFSYGQNETRPFYTSEDVLFDSLMNTHRALPDEASNFEDVAVAITVDVGGPSWLYNSGALIFKPSATSSFLWDSTIYLFNHTSVATDPDFAFTGDQGMLSMVLRDGFDFVSEFHRQMVFKVATENLEPPCEDNQLIGVHRINLQRLLMNPVLAQVTRKWFPKGEIPPEQPDSVAVVCTRWFNAPACDWATSKGSKIRKLQRFHCDDFAAHMNGCSKALYRKKTFRNLFKEKDRCKESFSLKTNNDGSPFTWEQWDKLR